MPERALCAARKPNIRSHDHSFRPIINSNTVLEISVAHEYVGIIFIPFLRNIKNSDFVGEHFVLLDDHENH